MSRSAKFIALIPILLLTSSISFCLKGGPLIWLDVDLADLAINVCIAGIFYSVIKIDAADRNKTED